VRVWLALIPLFGCEMEVTPNGGAAAPPPSIELQEREFPDLQFLDVNVREYGTDVPISGATIDLVQWTNECVANRRKTCPGAKRLSAVTDATGTKRFQLPWPKWIVEGVTAPGGYLTDCPTLSSYEEAKHRLVTLETLERDLSSSAQVIPPARTIYTCRPVSPSALVVRDKKAATKLAKALPEMTQWLRSNRDARVTEIELVGIRWEVRFETTRTPGIEMEDHETRLVFVDGLDEQAYVRGRWGGVLDD
jgi:hypothetical protein